MPKQARKGLDYLHLRGGTWWTKIDGQRLSTGCPKPEVVAAKSIRDQRLAERALRRAGVRVETPLPLLTLGQLLDSYIAAEWRDYDRTLPNSKQPGTKRGGSKSARIAKARILRYLDPSMLAADLTPEHVVRLGESIAREPSRPSGSTVRKHCAFLRSAYNWAAERPSTSGIRVSPFALLNRSQRRALFPKSQVRGYVFTPDQLRALYALARWRKPLLRFAVHTGMRLREITTLRWSCVDLNRRVVTVLSQQAKNGREREVPLGDVAFGILAELRPEHPNPDAFVFVKRNGQPWGTSLQTWWVTVAMPKVWTPSKPSERRPRFHDLRKTCATRVESVSSHAVAKRLLGHLSGDITATYIMPSDDDVRAALNRAARLIDGEQVGNVVPFAATSAASSAV
jgi:integrase